MVATTLDEYVFAEALPRVDLIKIDVEGAEGRCLAGAAKTVQVHRPVVVSEINPVCLARDGLRPEDVIDILCARAYRVGWLRCGKNKQATTIVALPPEREDLLRGLEGRVVW